MSTRFEKMLSQVQAMHLPKQTLGRVVDQEISDTVDLSLMKEHYTIGPYCCEKCCWYPGENWDHVKHITLDVEGEMVSPCEKCGTYNLIDLDLIIDPNDGLSTMYAAMDSFIDLVFGMVRRVNHEEFLANPHIKRPTTYSEPIPSICVNCGDKIYGYCRTCPDSKYEYIGGRKLK